MDEDGKTLATEILQELRASAKRWFIAFLVMLAVEIGTVIGFLWYLSLPVEESTVTQTMQEVADSSAAQVIGG